MEAAELQSQVLTLGSGLKAREKADRAAVTVPVDQLFSVMKTLRDDPRFQFDMLCDHTAVDWIKENRFELIYQLHSVKLNHYLMVAVDLPREKPVAPTMAELWAVAHWQEREVFDLQGVIYEGHTDLRRLFLEDDWVGHPLRKDYKDDFMLERPW